MMDRERRLSPRAAVGKHAYIDIEPNNGAIVLNVSAGGLSFHSFDPVRTGNTRFWFCDRKQRIEADGEIVWTDETHKGGLRFNAIPAEARELIANWMSQAQPVPGPVPVPTPAATPPPHEVKVKLPLTGFSGGLALGLLFTFVVTTGFLFHIYRGQIGESLIQLGQKFASQPQTPSPAILPSAEVALPAARVPSSNPKVEVAAEKEVIAPAPQKSSTPPPKNVTPDSPKPAAQTHENTPAPSQVKLETAPPPAVSNNAVAAAHTTDRPAAKNALMASAVVPPPINLPASTKSAAANPASVPVAAPEVHTEVSKAQNPDPTSQMFFEVGKYKNRRDAKVEIAKLSGMGFPASSVQKNHLWNNAFHVVVGPYDDDQEASATHKDLVSHGFTPKPFERGSRYLTLKSEMKLNGKAIPLGECVVNWESYATDATVKIVHDNSLVASTEGHWVNHGSKFDTDAYLYAKNPDGSRTLLEIRFAGMKQALELSPTPQSPAPQSQASR